MAVVRPVEVGSGFPSLADLRDELDEYLDVLMGRVEPPLDLGVSTLMELASVYYARAKEIEMLLHRVENEGIVPRNSKHYKFRTGELRSFIELAKSASDMGSRRITAARSEWESAATTIGSTR